MERIMTAEERIRRAEEIYYKRKNQGGIRVSTNSMNISENRKISLGKKMGIQIMVCVIIYSIFWLIKDRNNVFSTNFINETRNILNYDINLSQIYNNVQEYFSKNFNNIIKINDSVNEINNVTNDVDSNNIENKNDIQNVNDVQNIENNQNEGNVQELENTADKESTENIQIPESTENSENIQNNQNDETIQNIENISTTVNNPNNQTIQDIRNWWWK